MDTTIPYTLQVIFSNFVYIFTTPSFENFMTMLLGWIQCNGRHTISRVIQAAGERGHEKHFSALYRFFSRAVWMTDAAGRVLFDLAAELVPGSELTIIVDDTLCRKSGPHFFGAGMHYDPLRSTYKGLLKASKRVALAFGHNWVILALWIPVPWNPKKGLAIPFLFRLYRSKKYCPKSEYKKRTEIAAELVAIVTAWTVSNRKFVVVGDGEYACCTLVRSLPENIGFVGPMLMTAALNNQLKPTQGKNPVGYPAKKGKRLPTPEQLAANANILWKKITVTIYGRKVKILIKTCVCLWYKVAHTRPVRMVVTRDPKGRIKDRAYFSTDLNMSVEEILITFSKRWTLEVTFHDAKQFLGLEDPQNGWWRRPKKKRAKRKIPGPQAKGKRGKLAIEHTVPFALATYAITCIWYIQHGNARADVKAVKKIAPWYRHKTEPSFADMLQALRKEILIARIKSHPTLHRVEQKLIKLIPTLLLAG